MSEPVFTTNVEQTGKGWMVSVNDSTDGPGLFHQFYDRDKLTAERKAQAFIASRRARFLKAQAAKESRKAGYYTSLVKPPREALSE